jgi:exonuclease SbcC
VRLHRLEIRNLASLRSDEPIVVDFDEGLRGAPLFAIVGPTGAGKSTLLDAIQLALFGETARLPKSVAKSVTPAELGPGDPRQILSRGAREAAAELEFSLLGPEGTRRRYRARWSCRLARTKISGPERTLSEYDETSQSWGPERGGSQEKIYDPIFNEALGGMNVGEFNRTMLLAQGQFAALLHSPPAERVALLERVTRTEFYRKIGKRAAARYGEVKRALGDAQSASGAIDLPPEDFEATREARLVELVAGIDILNAQLSSQRGALAWMERAAELDADVARAEDAVASAARERSTHAPDLARLNEARRVDEAARRVDAVLANEAQIARRTADLEAERAALAPQRERKETAALAEADARAAAQTAKSAREAAAPELAAAEEAWTSAERAQAALKAATVEADAAQKQLDAADASARRAEAASGEAERKLGAHDADSDSVQARVAACRAALTELCGTADPDDAEQQARAQRDDHVGRAQHATAACARLDALTKAEAELAHAEQNLAELAARAAASLEAATTAERAFADAVRARDDAEAVLAQLRRIEVFVEDRAALVDGEPCPLCGSPSHNVAALPSADGVHEELAARRRLVEAAKQRVETAHKELSRVERERAVLAEKRTALDAAIAKHRDRQAEAMAELEAALATLGLPADARNRDELVGLGAIAKQQEGEARARAEAVRGARQALDAAQKAAVQAAEVRGALSADVAAAQAALQAARAGLDTAREARRVRDAVRVDAEAALEAARAACTEVLGGRRPQVVRQELQQACDRADAVLAAATAAAGKAASDLSAAEARVTARARELEEATREAERLEAELGLALAEVGLSRAEVEARRLTGDERATLEQLEARVERETLTAATTLAGALEKRGAHEAARPAGPDESDPDGTELRARIAELEAKTAELQTERGAIQTELQHAAETRARAAAFAEKLRAAREEHDAWSRIHEVIGVGDGAAFALFAQSLGLEELLWQANRELAFLNPRYEFRRTGDKLEFGVLDRDQLDELRPLSTLSGGETFLCSLALALGLARWRQSTIPIETLLLDEGFGTLDGETLGTAMSALQRLCSAGNMRVGVVTHVEAMRERIDARIVVEKAGGGRSTVRVVA